MALKKYRYLPLVLLLLIGSISVPAQKKQDARTAEEYEGRQRALSLILLDSKIKSLDDAPIRCTARIEVIRFLVESGPKDLYPYAHDSAVICLNETVLHPKEFSTQAGFLRTSVIGLIRKIDRVRGDELEDKYPVEGFAKFMARNQELTESKDPTRVAAKVITDIRAGSIPDGISSFVSRLRLKDAMLADAVLESILTHYESRPDTFGFNREFFSIAFRFIMPDTTPALRDRFLMLALNLGRRAMADRSDNQFVKMAGNLLRASASSIRENLPQFADEANSLSQALLASQTEAETREQAAYQRISDADDKLAATIEEAKNAKDESLQQRLWRSASNIALRENKFRLAIELLGHLKNGSGLSWRRFMLTEAIPRRAIRVGDFEAVDAALDELEKASEKSRICFLAATELDRKGSKEQALTYFRGGLALLAKADGTSGTLRQFANAVTLAIRLKEGDIFGMGRSFVAATNRLPSPDAKDLKESKGRRGYVSSILFPAAAAVTQLFNTLAEKDPYQAYTISQGIQRRDLRLIAEISVEKFKKYPLRDAGRKDQRSSAGDQ